MFHHVQRHMHTARDWQIYSDFQEHFWQTFSAPEPCIAIQSYVAGQNSFTQIQIALSGDLFEIRTDIQNRKTEIPKLGTRFDVCWRDNTTPAGGNDSNRRDDTSITHKWSHHVAQFRRATHTKKKKLQPRMQCISDYNAARPTVHAYSARDAAVHQAKKSIGPSATVSLVKNVQADDCQWCRKAFHGNNHYSRY